MSGAEPVVDRRGSAAANSTSRASSTSRTASTPTIHSGWRRCASDLANVFQDENPFFRHGEMQLFLARRGSRDVGRIAAILDRNHNAFHGEKVVFFGFFESENDPETASRLLEAAAVWGRERKMTVLRGPTNPTLNDEAGLLVDGFDSPPVLMMTYNPRYYAPLLEGQGLGKAKDLLAYWFPLGEKPLERLSRVAERFRRREAGIVVRNVAKRSLARDLREDPGGLQRGLGEELGLRSDDARGDGLHGQALEAAPGARASLAGRDEGAGRLARARRLHADAS